MGGIVLEVPREAEKGKALSVTTLDPDEEPTINVRIEDGPRVPFLVNTGETYSCVGRDNGSKLPCTSQTADTTGFWGKRLTLYFTEL